MNKYILERTTKFRKDYKSLEKSGYDMTLLDDVIIRLAEGETLPTKYCDHPLHGTYKGYRDCHIRGDWVLIYKIDKDTLILLLTETGTHSEILE